MYSYTIRNPVNSVYFFRSKILLTLILNKYKKYFCVSRSASKCKLSLMDRGDFAYMCVNLYVMDACNARTKG